MRGADTRTFQWNVAFRVHLYAVAGLLAFAAVAKAVSPGDALHALHDELGLSTEVSSAAMLVMMALEAAPLLLLLQRKEQGLVGAIILVIGLASVGGAATLRGGGTCGCFGGLLALEQGSVKWMLTGILILTGVACQVHRPGEKRT